MPIGSGSNSTPPLSRVDGTPGTRPKSSEGNTVSADGKARTMNGKKQRPIRNESRNANLNEDKKNNSADEHIDTGLEYQTANPEQNVGRVHGRTGLSWKTTMNNKKKMTIDRPAGG